MSVKLPGFDVSSDFLSTGNLRRTRLRLSQAICRSDNTSSAANQAQMVLPESPLLLACLAARTTTLHSPSSHPGKPTPAPVTAPSAVPAPKPPTTNPHPTTCSPKPARPGNLPVAPPPPPAPPAAAPASAPYAPLPAPAAAAPAGPTRNASTSSAARGRDPCGWVSWLSEVSAG